MTMWYRTAQEKPKKPKEPPAPLIEDVPADSEKSGLYTSKATPEEIETAKKIVELRNAGPIDDATIAKMIEQSKPAHMEMKKLATALNDIANFIPFENLKPTFRQYANQLNSAAEQYLATIISTESREKETAEQAKKTLDKFNTWTLQNVPNDVDSVLNFLKKQDINKISYFVNLIGDFVPGSQGPIGQLVISKFRIRDYEQTWLPFFNENKNLFIAAKNKYNSTKDIEEKQKAEEEMQKHFAMILGFISNASMDLSSFCLGISIITGPAAPAVAAVAGVLRTIGIGIQAVSWIMDPESPVYGMINILQGLPYSPDEEEEKQLAQFTRIKANPKDEVEVAIGELQHAEAKSEMFNNPYFPILKRLNEIYIEINPKDWESTYGQKKTEFMYNQPLNTLMKFAYDKFGQKYFWMNQPESPKYRNFGRLLSQAKNYVRSSPKIKPPQPSKRSIGYQLVDSALNNQMTNQFSAPLIREMANKYTAGNIYNFLNKKNVEINNLISNEARNANFAARFNVRPGSAGLDLLKVDIMNLKKILNTWK